MKQFSHIIGDEIGMHARPAGLLVKEAKKLSSKITITYGEKSAEATKLMALIALAAKKGEEIIVTVEGGDEDASAAHIEAFLKDNL